MVKTTRSCRFDFRSNLTRMKEIGKLLSSRSDEIEVYLHSGKRESVKREKEEGRKRMKEKEIGGKRYLTPDSLDDKRTRESEKREGTTERMRRKRKENEGESEKGGRRDNVILVFLVRFCESHTISIITGIDER